jgi:branched-chain amino acid transport system substrate-binding protein
MDPDISKKSDYTFRLYEGMWEEGEKIMEYLSNDKSNSKTGIIYVRIPATEIVVQNVFLPYLKKQNKEIACIESYEFGNKDFKNIILKIKHSLPKHLIIYDYGFNFPILFDELNTQGILGKTEIIGGWGFLYSLMTKQMDLKLLDGVVVAGPSFIVKKNANADIFIKKFKNTFNYEPNFDGAFAYESIMILSTALKETTSDRIEELIKSLKNKEFTGITGKIKINNNRDLIADMVIGIIRDGVIQPIDLEKNEK